MRQTDVVIIGGGMAGSTAAAMLAHRGVAGVLVDPHPVYPADFRCEKLDQSQLAVLAKTGVGDRLLAAATPSHELWVARRGRVVEQRPNQQVAASYDAMVNAMRSVLGGSVSTVIGKCAALATSRDRQVVTLTDGEQISARLVIVANGLNSALRRNFGLERKDISPAHSVAIGFDIAPESGNRFPFNALTYYPEAIGDDVAYLTLFPVGSGMRGNLFVYRQPHDPWLKAMRDRTVETLLSVMPRLARIAGAFKVTSFVQVRPADLYQTTGTDRPGMVVIGDAFATSCPAAGTGLNKVLTDVERLVNHHLVDWLATPGMSAEKTRAFYADPIKAGTDAWSLDRAMYVKALSTQQTLAWRTRREIRYVGQVARGRLRTVASWLQPQAAARAGTAGASGN